MRNQNKSESGTRDGNVDLFILFCQLDRTKRN